MRDRSQRYAVLALDPAVRSRVAVTDPPPLPPCAPKHVPAARRHAGFRQSTRSRSAGPGDRPNRFFRRPGKEATRSRGARRCPSASSPECFIDEHTTCPVGRAVRQVVRLFRPYDSWLSFRIRSVQLEQKQSAADIQGRSKATRQVVHLRVHESHPPFAVAASIGAHLPMNFWEEQRRDQETGVTRSLLRRRHIFCH